MKIKLKNTQDVSDFASAYSAFSESILDDEGCRVFTLLNPTDIFLLGQQFEKFVNRNSDISIKEGLIEIRSRLRVIHSKVEDGRISSRADFVKEIESVITETVWNH